ncbi:MAG: response regulator [Flavobacteriales bacterium]
MKKNIQLLSIVLCVILLSNKAYADFYGLFQNTYLDSVRNVIVQTLQSRNDYDKVIEMSNDLIDTLPYIENIDADLYELQIVNYQSTAYRLGGFGPIAFDILLEVDERILAKSTKNHPIHYNIYSYIASFYAYQCSSDKAFEYFKKAEEVAVQFNDFSQLAKVYYNIFIQEIENDDTEEAMFYIKKCEALEPVTLNMDSIKNSITNLAYAKYYHHLYKEEAFKYFEEAIKYEQDDLHKNFIIHTYSEYLASHGYFKKAYDQFLKFYNLEKKANKSENEQKINILEKKYKNKENLAQIEQLELENRLNSEKSELQGLWVNITSVLAIVLIISLLILYKNFNHQKNFSIKLKHKNQELFEAKQVAEELSKLKSKFTENVSHELRTPLHGIIGLTSILIRDEKNKLSLNGQDVLDSLKSSGDYLLNLINDVLEISKIDADKIVLENNPFNMEQLVENVQSSLQFNIDRKNIEFITKVDPEIPEVLLGDSMRVSQVLINLVGNALKFTHSGFVKINVTQLEETQSYTEIKFEIEDTGIGIPIEKRKLIFDKFSQIQNIKSNLQGTGLGLSIVKEVLIKLNSEIHLKSEINKGSKFWFIIKFNKSVNSIVESQSNMLNFKFEEKVNNKKILIVDDNEINLIVTKHLLESHNFKIETSKDGEEAIKTLKHHEFDLVLMDLHMPKMDGIEATKIIRSQNVQIPIILLTASNVHSTWGDYENIGFNDFVSKPYDKYLFLSKIADNLKM